MIKLFRSVLASPPEALRAARPTSLAMRETESFGPNPGQLRMFSFLPDRLPANAPLVVVLHGCRQTADGHAAAAGWLALAQRYGFCVMAPEQTSRNSLRRCFNWFAPGDAARGQGEAASTHAMINYMIATQPIDADRVFITGLSAGGAMASAMLASYPEVFAGGAVIAGLPHGAADTVLTALLAMRGLPLCTDARPNAYERNQVPGTRIPRVTVWHGDADSTVDSVNAERIARQWTHAHSIPFMSGRRERQGRVDRTVWRSASTGNIVVERNIVRGLGHGTPLSSLGRQGIGSAAPYMLEAKVSAVIEVARFWELEPLV